ncbi:MAG: hypothetical protein V1789_11425 [PVC group bacterium]
MKKSSAGKVLGRALPLILVIFLLPGWAAGCKKSGKKPPTIDVEKIIDFTGEIKVTFPSGDVQTFRVGDTLVVLPENTLVEVLSEEGTGLLAGKIILLKKGQIARIIKPGVTAQKVIQFTGELKIVLPDGTIIYVKAGEPLPTLPPGTRIEVISGELVVIWGDERIILTPGDVAWIEPLLDEETPASEGGDISPVSPFEP